MPYRKQFVNGIKQTVRKRERAEKWKAKRLQFIFRKWKIAYYVFRVSGFGIKIFECFMPKMSLRQM